MENKLLIICGPTATGKTGLGIRLAKKFKGEIVSADSRQVYRGMDIGTGKDHPKEMEIHLIDVVKPNQEFSVAQYVDLAWKVIEDIWKRGKVPIIVGGTGFYIKGLIEGIETLGIPPDWKLRQHLKEFPAQKLFEMLARLDSEKAALMNASDRKNPRRLVRAIEIASKQQTANSKQLDTEHCKLDAFFIGLTASYKTLYQRIDKRIDKQIKMGAEKEVERLLAQGYTWDLPAMTAMGYGVWKPYFEKKATLEEIISRWKYDEHAYARRQMIWFKRDRRIRWFDISKKGWETKVEKLVLSWYTKKDEQKD